MVTVAESSQAGTASGATRSLDDAQEDTTTSKPASASSGTDTTGGSVSHTTRAGIERKSLADPENEEEPDTTAPEPRPPKRLRRGQTYPAVLYHNKVYCQSPEAATYGSPENPLEIELPALLDFQEFVWGNEVSSEAIAKVGHVMTIGLEDEDDGDKDHHRRVFDIWRTLLQWHELCLTDKPKPLILAFHQMPMGSFRLATQPCTQPREDLAERQTMSVLDKRGCSVQIERILQKGGQEMENELDIWLMGESAGTCLSVGDRIEIINFLWCRRASNGDEVNRCEGRFKSRMEKYSRMACAIEAKLRRSSWPEVVQRR
ncbi:hypothetical protein FDENT_4298 [Fusarium denticulatum]|uniref:Uncharacterized protein n=1 Tax=Fusarium denticulatum TaxID=48507 RepID=A0A8H5ULW6_9HYPO|nr:hypothetical protein FDENT_4298 [Fusarium denticulatum]